jgi:hypothetical protein
MMNSQNSPSDACPNIHSKNWQKICDEVESRRRALNEALAAMTASHQIFQQSLEAASDPALLQFQIAAMDVFVEEAQQSLNTQAFRQFWWGVGLALFAVVLLGSGFWYIAARPFGEPAEWSDYTLTLRIVTAISLGGILVLAVVFVMQLARASLHESTINYSRHHALRFGRLYVYLFPGQLTYEQVEKAFGWTGMFSTGFQWMKIGSISPKHPMEGTLGALTELVKQARTKDPS